MYFHKLEELKKDTQNKEWSTSKQLKVKVFSVLVVIDWLRLQNGYIEPGPIPRVSDTAVLSHPSVFHPDTEGTL